MKTENKMIGTIIIVFTVLCMGLLAAYLNTGFLATMAIAGAFIVMALLVTFFLEKREKKLRNNNQQVLGYTGEAIGWKHKCSSDFERLVSVIAFYRLKESGRTIGVEEDMKNAFLEAVKEVHSANSDNSHSGAGAVQDRIEQLIKKYETP